MANIRRFDGFEYARVSEKLTRNQAVAKAKRIRKITGIPTRIDTYKGGFAVWKRISGAPRIKKEQSGHTWIKDGQQMPKGYNPLAEGGVIGGTYELVEDKPRRKLKPLRFVEKQEVKVRLSNKAAVYKDLKRKNARSKYWSPRMELIAARTKFQVKGERFQASAALHYYNDAMEDERIPVKEAIVAGGYHVLMSVKIDEHWYGTHSNVEDDYKTARADYAHAKEMIRRFRQEVIRSGSDSAYEMLYNHFREEHTWEKFE